MSETPEVGASPILAVENAIKSYPMGRGTIDVLKNFSVSFDEGISATVCGPSGCGKSTLLQILGGLDRLDSGKVLFRGENLADWSRSRLAEWRNKHVGFVFQSYHLIQELTALENVDIPGMLGGRSDRKQAEALLERMGLADRMHHLPRELSGGEQQRVAIARALRNDPELILADEPTGNLDIATAGGIADLLWDLQRERRATLIVVTHDPGIAVRGNVRVNMVK